MTDGKGNDEGDQERLDRPRKLELKKTVDVGQVRQSFAHGRSKLVRVEVRKKRTYAPDAHGLLAKLPEGERRAEPSGSAGARGTHAEGVAREGAAVRLTTEEKAQRARALQDAKRVDEGVVVAVPPHEEEGTVTVIAVDAESAADVIVPAPTEEGLAPAVDVEAIGEAGVAETERVAVEEAPEAAEPVSSVEAAQEAQPVAVRAAPVVPVEVPKIGVEEEAAGEEEGEQKGRLKRVLKTDIRRPLTAPRRGEARRRTGKLTVVDALEDRDRGERVRSLAAVRRAREKERLKHRQMGLGELQKIVREVIIPEAITVQELSNRMAERSADVIKALMNIGVMATINQTIDADTAELIATEFGHHVKRVSDADIERGLRGEVDVEENLVPRPPVVTVMGHVDHGKTSLLDALRKTDVAVHEAGGITQHIGAYQITVAGGAKVTFIDTPGHAAFTEMRARGAHVTDIVVLVVSADDGVMPQTIEAINHAKAARVPLIVAINKIDRPDANPAKVRTELLQYEVVVEEMGGETLNVEVSAKTGANLDKLVDAILLQAEILDLRSNPNRLAEGVVVEAKMERGRGSVATVLVQRGTLRVGDIFVAGSEWGRVRGLLDASGAALTEVGPGTPAEIVGLNGTPAAGDEVTVVLNEAQARDVTEFRQRKQRDAKVAAASGRTSLEQMFERAREGGEKTLAVVIKADVHGSAEAIAGALEKLGDDEVKAHVLHTAVGGINESDVTLARASDALIVGFNVRANPQAREMARRDGVDIRYYSVIYDLVDDLKKVLSGLLAPRIRENVLGYAEIREVFSISKVGKIAGCMVTEGQIRRGSKVRLVRDDVVVHQGELAQLKRFKDDVREVREGYDCGVALAGYQDIQVGDIIECFELQEVERAL
jgi:translation initiation factor IF-2